MTDNNLLKEAESWYIANPGVGPIFRLDYFIKEKNLESVKTIPFLFIKWFCESAVTPYLGRRAIEYFVDDPTEERKQIVRYIIQMEKNTGLYIRDFGLRKLILQNTGYSVFAYELGLLLDEDLYLQARVIQNACESWLWKPVCRDGLHSIHAKILLELN